MTMVYERIDCVDCFATAIEYFPVLVMFPQHVKTR